MVSPVGPTARASGADANGDGNSPGDQWAPPSVLWATGENFSFAETRNPTVKGPEGAEPTTRPPLLATPGGVCSAHEALPAGSRKTSQNVLLGLSRCPMANTTEDPVGVVVDAPSGTGDGLGAPAAPAPPDIVKPISATAAMTQRVTNA